MHRPPFALLLALALATAAVGCSTVYYAIVDRLGWAQHDLLAQRIQLARDSQDQARVQFADALPLFGATGPEPPSAAALAAQRASYDDCSDSAALVRARVAAVADAAEPFFAEWREEIAAAPATSRAREQQRYDTFRQRYERVLAAMRDAQAAIPPVLDAMRAEVAARAAGAAAVPPLPAGDADLLLRTLQLAVALADQFIAELETID